MHCMVGAGSGCRTRWWQRRTIKEEWWTSNDSSSSDRLRGLEKLEPLWKQFVVSCFARVSRIKRMEHTRDCRHSINQQGPRLTNTARLVHSARLLLQTTLLPLVQLCCVLGLVPKRQLMRSDSQQRFAWRLAEEGDDINAKSNKKRKSVKLAARELFQRWLVNASSSAASWHIFDSFASVHWRFPLLVSIVRTTDYVGIIYVHMNIIHICV